MTVKSYFKPLLLMCFIVLLLSSVVFANEKAPSTDSDTLRVLSQESDIVKALSEEFDLVVYDESELPDNVIFIEFQSVDEVKSFINHINNQKRVVNFHNIEVEEESVTGDYGVRSSVNTHTRYAMHWRPWRHPLPAGFSSFFY